MRELVAVIALLSCIQIGSATDVDTLKLGSKEEREASRRQLLAERNKVIDGLLQILKDDPSKKGKPSREELSEYRVKEIFAVELLGELRAEKALPLLFERLGKQYVKFGSIDEGDPVFKALRLIGKPASKAASTIIPNEPSKERIKMLTQVIKEIEGSELAHEMIQIAYRRETDKEKKARLRHALTLFKDVVPQ